MNKDVADIRDFYQSRLGRVASRTIAKKIQKFWPDISDDTTIIGMGYAIPYMPMNSQTKAIHIAAMPASQGVVNWPWRGAGRTVLTEDHVLPFDDQSIDRMVVVHSLEHSEHLDDLMKEIWRVLKGSGRLLVIIPNRTGMWARADHTPFGHGQPYSNSQIRDVLKSNQFVPVMTRYALFFPPLDRRFILSAAWGLEWIGQRLFSKIGGVSLIEASKQLYSITPHGKKSPAHILRQATTSPAQQARTMSEKA